MFKKDNILLGILIGAAMPVVVSIVVKAVNIFLLDNPEFDIMNSKPALMGCLAINVLLFRVFMVNIKKYAMGKGILLATLVFAFLILIQ